jgi:hypothetical protein
MALQVDPWAIQGESHSAEIARSTIAGLLGTPAAAFTAGVSVTTAGGGHGIVGATDLAVTQNGTPNMSVNVAAGRAFIRGGVSAGAIGVGVYGVMNDATTNVAIAASDPTNPRIDLVCVQVRDTNYGEAASDARFFVVTGTPAGVPAVPSVASLNVLVLAQVAVAAATTTIVTANITDKRTRASALGGIQPVTTANRGTGASLSEGVAEFDLDTNDLLFYSGSAFSTVGPVHGAGKTWTPAVTQSGSVTVTVTDAKYWRVGRLVHAFAKLAVTGSGTAGNIVTVTVPFTAAAANTFVGIGSIFDTSASTFYSGTARLQSTTVVAIIPHNATSYLGSAAFSAGLAAGDNVDISITYEAAADA